MNLDDVLDDALSDDEIGNQYCNVTKYNLSNDVEELKNKCLINELDLIMEQLEHEQALISKKSNHHAYSVNRTILNSKAYHDKFDKLPLNKMFNNVCMKNLVDY